MAYNVNATWDKQARRISGSYLLDMYILNASRTGENYMYYVNAPQDVYGFKLDANGDLTALSQVYTGLPVKRGDISSNTNAEISGVDISIPNVDRSIEGIIQGNRYLRGCEVFVVTAFAQHLPSGSSATYVGSAADYNAVLKDLFYIDSVNSDENAVTFNCRSKFDINSIVLPARTFSRECAWAMDIGDGYLGSQCDPSSTISATTFPTCDGTLKQCEERDSKSHYGGFPSIPRSFILVS